MTRLDPWGTVLFAGLAVRWSLLWQDALQQLPDGLWAGHEYIWSDWPTHIGIVTRFAYGDNFPPVNTLFAGLPLSYHYLSDLTPAAFVLFGMAVVQALPFHSLVLSLVAALSLWAFIRRLGIATSIATLGTFLFLFGAGLAWITTAGLVDATTICSGRSSARMPTRIPPSRSPTSTSASSTRTSHSSCRSGHICMGCRSRC